MQDAIALIDMDGTLADYDFSMRAGLDALRSPEEPPLIGKFDDAPLHIKNRRNLISRSVGFWRNLPRIKHGFEIVDELRALKFTLHILTKGPASKSMAWAEKVEWCRDHIPDAYVNVMSAKELVYGRVLVDDWPEYFMPWLDNRPRGFVVAVAQPWNEHIQHPNVLRYDGSNRVELRARLQQAYEREAGTSSFFVKKEIEQIAAWLRARGAEEYAEGVLQQQYRC